MKKMPRMYTKNVLNQIQLVPKLGICAFLPPFPSMSSKFIAFNKGVTEPFIAGHILLCLKINFAYIPDFKESLIIKFFL
jgi:hypothetical protein